jgi:quercetin dioxygenase-like cupin family protein
MPLNQLEKESLATDKPVIRSIYQADQSKLLAVGMKTGVVLPEHTAPTKAKLMVVKGEIDFNTETESIRLAAPDSLEIPEDVVHSVEAYNDAMFLLHLEQEK